ncbi:ATP-dependent helicase [Anaerotruncus rubiinfantis]|uniref:ATP-dependent helicase n=1 Tax=Anaerotruncus rubiinfantis TaxID=1720200 RepID=UPI0011CA12E6|nr:3'-5' exonuclease [Anaerotruncus rubiinfantis]
MSATAGVLNAQQSLAAENKTDHILLLAGAGTGKTSTLAWRVANLLTANAAKPEEILCLTFTNRACKEMVERIEKIAGAPARAVTVRTIHSFCAWLLRQTPGSFTDIGCDFTVCDTDDAREVIREVVYTVTGRELADRPATILQNFIGLVKDCQLAHPAGGISGAAAEALTVRRAETERICVDAQYQFDPKFYAFLAKYGASIVRLYNEKLLQNNTLDFSDLLIRASLTLSDPQTKVLWRGRYRYIHIDEVQDVSIAEYELLQKLCGNAVILLAGDFNQTIYQWRGSNPDALLNRFTAEYHPLVIEFTINYRSSGQLLAVAQNFLYTAFGKGIPGGPGISSPACTDVTVRSFDTLPEEVDWIYRELQKLDLADYSRAAIITRTNKACNEVCNLLKTGRPGEGKPVPFMLADEFRLFKRAESKDALACLSVIANPRDSESLKRILVRLLPGVGAATVNAVISRYKEGLGVALPDFIDPRTQRTGDFFAPLIEALDAGKVVVFDVESTGTDVYADDIVQMAAVRLAPDGAVAARFERYLRPSRPVGESERVHGFSDAFLAERGDDPADALGAFLDFTDGCVIVGHNVGFDMAITQNNLRRRAVRRPFANVWYDTLDLSRRFLKDLPDHKLITVSAALGAAHDPTHDAMDDILATADVLTALILRYLIPRTEARRACYAQYIGRFAQAFAIFREVAGKLDGLDLPGLFFLVRERFGLDKAYADDPEKRSSLELLADYAADCVQPGVPLPQQIANLLELSALTAGELSQRSRTGNKVPVITAHQSKGCEFDYVFLPVLQEGVFPTFQAVRSGDVTEEKRVFYVSITRAKRKLFLSYARYGLGNSPAKPSRFLEMLG